MGIFKDKDFKKLVTTFGSEEYTIYSNAIATRNNDLNNIYDKLYVTREAFKEYEGYEEIEDMQQLVQDTMDELISLNEIIVSTFNSLEGGGN